VSTDLSTIEQSVWAIAPETHIDTVAAVIDRVGYVEKQLKEFKASLEERLTEWVKTNGDLTIGDVRYYLGTKKTTKCANVPETIQAILETTGGDFDRLCEHLSSGCVKYGAAKETLGDERFGLLFTVAEETEIREGKPVKVKRLQKTNDAFVR
jgi:hypothetical protein